MSTLPNTQSGELENMSEESWFDEDTEEYVWELSDEQKEHMRKQFQAMREADNV